MNSSSKTIVVSAVSLRKGGTLTILRDCLAFLSVWGKRNDVRIIAIVHDRNLALYPDIEYIEKPGIIKGWTRRLWFEYITASRISRQVQPVSLWLSLHDTSPRVAAERQAVYCQTSFPFLKWKWKDICFDYKIVLFTLFTRWAYRINVHANRYLVVQQEWLREGLSSLLKVDRQRFIVAPPENNGNIIQPKMISLDGYNFFYASTPDCHKNFELLCKAAELLEKETGTGKFKVILTVKGNENRYARSLYKRWGQLDSVVFAGFLSKDVLAGYYQAVDCMIFPSRVETWGLPISEFAAYGKPMLLADLPYAHETSAGSRMTAFFNPEKPEELKELMKRLINGDNTFLTTVRPRKADGLTAVSWQELFDKLLE